jgi:5-methyltetrahydrofolate--homocysteine methyltransferase
MSALLVQTSNHMITVARMLKEAGLDDVDILIGGAPVNNRHAAYVSLYGQENADKLKPNVFYCPSGMDGVNVMNQLRESPAKRQSLVDDNAKKLHWHYDQAVLHAAKSEELLKTLPRRVIPAADLKRDAKVFTAPKFLSFSMTEFRPKFDLKTLFGLNWRYGGKNSWEKKGLSEAKLVAQLDDWIKRCDAKGWLKPQGMYAVLPCAADGDDVILFDPVDQKNEVARIPFTVVIGGEKKDILSAAQYFAPMDSKQRDAIGLQITTGGAAVDQQIEIFKAEGDSESSLLLQGLSDRVAEDMAECVHQLLRERLGIGPHEGTRYSPGYPGLRTMSVNQTLANLLGAEKTLGIRLTEAGEFHPTGTTGAVVCFHPLAKYD